MESFKYMEGKQKSIMNTLINTRHPAPVIINMSF